MISKDIRLLNLAIRHFLLYNNLWVAYLSYINFFRRKIQLRVIVLAAETIKISFLSLARSKT